MLYSDHYNAHVNSERYHIIWKSSNFSLHTTLLIVRLNGCGSKGIGTKVLPHLDRLIAPRSVEDADCAEGLALNIVEHLLVIAFYLLWRDGIVGQEERLEQFESDARVCVPARIARLSC